MKNKVWTVKGLIQELRKQKSVRGITNFANRNFGAYIGSGAYRTVWHVKTVRGEYVLKVAKNDYSIGSNRDELRLYRRYKRFGILAKIFHADRHDRYWWMLSEYVPLMIDEESMRRFFRIRQKTWDEQLSPFDESNLFLYFDERRKSNHRWGQEFLTIIERGKVYDLHCENWRMRSTGEPVIVDSGNVGH